MSVTIKTEREFFGLDRDGFVALNAGGIPIANGPDRAALVAQVERMFENAAERAAWHREHANAQRWDLAT